MTKIKNIISRQIFDSRGYPTIETDVVLENNIISRASVPSGASTGKHEACELRDNGKKFNGKSVYKAVSNVNGEIFDAINSEIIEKMISNVSLCELRETIYNILVGCDITVTLPSS